MCRQLVTKVGAGACAAQILPGLFFNSSTSFVRISDWFQVVPPVFRLVPGFTISLVFRSISQTGTLFVAWRSTSSYFIVQLINGQVGYHIVCSSGLIYVCVHVCVRVHVCLFTRACTCLCVRACVRAYVCLCVRARVCGYVCMFVSAYRVISRNFKLGSIEKCKGGVNMCKAQIYIKKHKKH